MKKWVQAKCLEMCLNSKHNFYSAFSALFYSSSTEAQPLHEGSGHPTFKSHAEHGCSVIIHSLTSECNAVSSACIFSVQSIVQIFNTLKQLIHCVEITFSPESHYAMSSTLHSKNSQVRFDPEKGPMGPDPFLGQTDLESRSK